jgi:hypothetical protein
VTSDKTPRTGASAWRKRFAWLLIGTTAWVANWWLGLVVPLDGIAVFLSTVISVSLLYALFWRFSHWMWKRQIGPFAFLSERLNDVLPSAFAIILVAWVTWRNVQLDKGPVVTLTTLAASGLGFAIAAFWRDILEEGFRRARDAFDGIRRGIRGSDDRAGARPD